MRSSGNPNLGPIPGPATFERSTWLPAPVAAVYAFHENPRNLEKISSRALGLRRVEAEPTARVGGRFRIVARPLGLLPLDWQGEWLAVEPPAANGNAARLIDGAVRAPFARFDHEHRFETEGAGTRMTDRVTYALFGPHWGPLGRLANALAAAFVLIPMFHQRHATTRKFFAASA